LSNTKKITNQNLRNSVVTFLFLLALLCSTSLHAVNNTVFVNKCGQCHHKNGPATLINPADKAGLVWIKYFKRHRHPVDLDVLITDDEMENILDYLQEHAADSKRPVAAAIPK